MADSNITLAAEGGFYPVENADVLVVLLHAYILTPASLQRVAEVVRDEYPRSDIYAPRLPVDMFSCADPEEIARGIVGYVDGLAGLAAYRSIILVGHSLGAVMARKVWALAHGATPAASVDRSMARPWAGKIDRVILLAATNRGWLVSSALNPWARLQWTLGTVVGNVLRHVFMREPTIFGFRRGAAFLTATRLQCLAVARFLADASPMTVQLLGTADDYVAPTDNLDLATGSDFYYLEVAEDTHRGIVQLKDDQGEAGALPAFRLALTGSRDDLQGRSLSKHDVFDLYDEALDDHDLVSLPQANLDVKHVVFVIHGIRDRGFWTRRIAREVKSLARRNNEACRAVTSTYGYFPMGPFLLPWVRWSKAEWLLDQYVTAKSIYPNAEFSYIGHSNGTYLLAKALEICPAISFKHVVFCGSVVPSAYGWSRLAPGRVGRILNYVATADYVVAIFPHGLERMRLQDLGGAGHNGFIDQAVMNIRHVEGGHGAALAKKTWKEMAVFALEGTFPTAPVPAPPQSTRVLWAGRGAPIAWLLIAVGVFWIGWKVLAPIGPYGWIFAFLFVLYLYVLRAILTRA